MLKRMFVFLFFVCLNCLSFCFFIDFIYIEASPQAPYQVCKIDEFIKVKIPMFHVEIDF